MIIFDASYLIVYLHPDPEPPMDRSNQPVTNFRERVNYLVATLNAADQIIGVPTPALAEILVRSGKGKYKYLQIIGDAYKFKVLEFDQIAAIEASELIAQIKAQHKSQPLGTWAKVKFDIQIAAISKAAGATMIYSDDTDIEAHGKRLKIDVKRICDLPLPPKTAEPVRPPADSAGQRKLFGSAADEEQDEEAREAAKTENPPELRADSTGGAGASAGAQAKEVPPTQHTEAKAPVPARVTPTSHE